MEQGCAAGGWEDDCRGRAWAWDGWKSSRRSARLRAGAWERRRGTRRGGLGASGGGETAGTLKGSAGSDFEYGEGGAEALKVTGVRSKAKTVMDSGQPEASLKGVEVPLLQKVGRKSPNYVLCSRAK